MAPPIRPVGERFWEKVAIRGQNDCWEWQFHYVGRLPYGQFWFQGKNHQAHRIAWTLTNGEIPAGLVVCHRCDNPRCCNPAHLFLGTTQDNMSDMKRKGRASRRFGESHPGSKLTQRDVDEIRKLYRKGVVTQQSLAERFGVDRAHVGQIVRGKSWRVRTE